MVSMVLTMVVRFCRIHRSGYYFIKILGSIGIFALAILTLAEVVQLVASAEADPLDSAAPQMPSVWCSRTIALPDGLDANGRIRVLERPCDCPNTEFATRHRP